ncbi:twin-arginine translocation signal domain-containing protein [Kutzneria sp. NPDC051319]|uniref:twin-arginine translocation signal domain-containing protein n=1 Tax=Kutzneria sp. NPDC051319 TaxID=3155047 RepID=UPI0034156741
MTRRGFLGGTGASTLAAGLGGTPAANAATVTAPVDLLGPFIGAITTRAPATTPSSSTATRCGPS